MIEITRRRARSLRAVFRRSALGIAHRGPVPPLMFLAQDGQPRARYRYGDLAVSCVFPGDHPDHAPVALPLDALADLEGRDDTPVALEALAAGRTVASWADRGIPVRGEYDAVVPPAFADLRGLPARLEACPPSLLDALAEAAAVAGEDTARYALGSIRLRGGAGEVAATDGRQLLTRSGFAFPWDRDVLIKSTPIFAARELPRDEPVRVGRTETHFVLFAGPWTIALTIRTGVRFPRLDDVVPAAGAATARLRLDPRDAAFLADALGRLDGDDTPVTLDLNGAVAVRSLPTGGGPATELVLARSSYTGTPIRVATDRLCLARAARLGLSELRISDAESPLAAEGGGRTYAWQPLSQESAVGPADDSIRIESTDAPAARPAPTPRSTAIMSSPIDANASRTDHPQTPPEPDAVAMKPCPDGGLAALIREAEAIHEALADAKARANRLVGALRRHRKQTRHVEEALRSLRLLKLQDAAG
jgi:hypothetical protein